MLAGEGRKRLPCRGYWMAWRRSGRNTSVLAGWLLLHARVFDGIPYRIWLHRAVRSGFFGGDDSTVRVGSGLGCVAAKWPFSSGAGGGGNGWERARIVNELLLGFWGQFRASEALAGVIGQGLCASDGTI